MCFQYNREQDGVTCFGAALELPAGAAVRVMHVDSRRAAGPCWARHLCGRLWQGEPYTLQLDSHMRMRPNWDEYLINMLAK